MYGRHFTFAARTSGQKAKRLEREPTVVNETADRKHHLDLLPTRVRRFFFHSGETPSWNDAHYNALRCSATNNE